MTVKNVVVRGATTSLSQADINLSNQGFLQTSSLAAGYNVSDVVVSTADSGIHVVNLGTTNNTCGKILAESFSAPDGFTVNVLAPLSFSKTYDILVVSGAHTTTLPTVGVNTTGKAVSFAWVGGTLKMTLA
jgi:hypothetical protein